MEPNLLILKLSFNRLSTIVIAAETPSIIGIWNSSSNCLVMLNIPGVQRIMLSALSSSIVLFISFLSLDKFILDAKTNHNIVY